MSGVFKSLRDVGETAASLVGNYYLPGSSLITSHLVSKGAQKALGSPVGQIGQLATGGFGTSAGNLSNYGNMLSSVGNSLGIGGTAAPATAGSVVTDPSLQGLVDAGGPAGGSVVTDQGLQDLIGGSGGAGAGSLTAGLTDIGNGLALNSAGSLVDSTTGATLGGATDVGSSAVPVGTGATSTGLSLPAAPAVGAGPSASGSTGIGSSFTDFLKSNKNLILPGASLAASLLTKPQIPDLSQLTALAQQSAAGTGTSPAATTAASLIPTVSTGQLPPSAQAGIQQGLQDAISTIKSKYANLGLSGSTMEAQEISVAENAAQAQSFNEANALTQTGLQAAGVSAGQTGQAATIYSNIINTVLAQDKALQDALANFSTSSSLGSVASALQNKS